jgi:hypothetical protein
VDVRETHPLYLSITRGCFGWNRRGLLAFLTYFDASGSGVDPSAKVISVGGFIGHETVWAAFEPKWQEILDRFSVPELHMKDYAHSRGAFVGWKDDKAKRDGFMREIAALVKPSGLQPVGATVPLSVYRLFNRHYCVEEFVGTSYTVAACMALANASEWRERTRPPEPILLFVEAGDNEQGDFRKLIARLKWEPDYVAEPIFMQKRIPFTDGRMKYVVPFQACDFMVYEQAKAMTDLIVHRKEFVRQSLRNAVRPIEDMPDGRSYWTLMEKEGFTKALTNFGVLRRFNHFNGGATNRNRAFMAPLGYIDSDHPVVGFVGSDGFIEDPDPAQVDRLDFRMLARRRESEDSSRR